MPLFRPPDDELVRDLQDLLDACREILGPETSAAVQHYLDHDEFEMALEGLLLELCRARRVPAGFDGNRWLATAAAFQLDTKPNFDGRFGETLTRWVESLGRR